jgi:hypothetical protein
LRNQSITKYCNNDVSLTFEISRSLKRILCTIRHHAANNDQGQIRSRTPITPEHEVAICTTSKSDEQAALCRPRLQEGASPGDRLAMLLAMCRRIRVLGRPIRKRRDPYHSAGASFAWLSVVSLTIETCLIGSSEAVERPINVPLLSA